jgi:hypothetical protein
MGGRLMGIGERLYQSLTYPSSLHLLLAKCANTFELLIKKRKRKVKYYEQQRNRLVLSIPVKSVLYFEKNKLLRASDGTLSGWSRLHMQSLAPTPVSRRVDVRQAAGRKNKLLNLYHNMIKNMLYRPHLVG